MVKRTLYFSLFTLSFAALGFLTSNSAHSQGGVKNVLFLQPTSPGVAQTGHANITGTMRAGSFVGNGSGLSGVIASNLLLPFTGTTDPTLPNAVMRLSSTGTGGVLWATQGTSLGSPILGHAIYSESGTGIGVWGRSSSGVGIRGQSETGIGALARTESGPYAFQAVNSGDGFVGVLGQSLGATGTGVLGQSNSTGVQGVSFGTVGTGVGVRGSAADSDGFGVLGLATSSVGTASGVKGESNAPTGSGVFGRSNSTTGISHGVFGWSDSNVGRGVYGFADSASGTTHGVYGESAGLTGRGVYGIATNTAGTVYGVFGETSSTGGAALYGLNTAATGASVGVRGEVESVTGRAVYGTGAISGSGTGYGGFFSVGTTTGRGVYGVAYSSLGAGIGGEFVSSGPGGYGVFAKSVNTGTTAGIGIVADCESSLGGYGGYMSASGTTARGVYGRTFATTGTNYGVRGESDSPSGYGLYSVGATGASGTKSFVIDHPDDPANKYLRHYSAEGPAPYNIYQGEVITDSKGYAWVELPSYFDAINKTPRIQLTAVSNDGEMVTAVVTKKVKDRRFQIRTSSPNTEVYWEVKAERNDAWVQAHPPLVEYDKDEFERGKYQHPELYGMPKHMGMDYIERKKSQAPVIRK